MIWIKPDKEKVEVCVEFKCPYCNQKKYELLKFCRISDNLLKEFYKCKKCKKEFVIEFERIEKNYFIVIRKKYEGEIECKSFSKE